MRDAGENLAEERKTKPQVIEAQDQRLTALADRIGDFLRNPRAGKSASIWSPARFWAINALSLFVKSPSGRPWWNLHGRVGAGQPLAKRARGSGRTSSVAGRGPWGG
jgi:hypothetical protein